MLLFLHFTRNPTDVRPASQVISVAHLVVQAGNMPRGLSLGDPSPFAFSQPSANIDIQDRTLEGSQNGDTATEDDVETSDDEELNSFWTQPRASRSWEDEALSHIDFVFPPDDADR